MVHGVFELFRIGVGPSSSHTMGQMSAAAMGGTPAQVPCIGRNAAGVVKAIESMRRTGADMSRKYKQTSLGGLAVNVVTC